MNTTDFEIITISLDDDKKEWEQKVFDLGVESWYNPSSMKKWDCLAVCRLNLNSSYINIFDNIPKIWDSKSHEKCRVVLVDGCSVVWVKNLKMKIRSKNGCMVYEGCIKYHSI